MLPNTPRSTLMLLLTPPLRSKRELSHTNFQISTDHKPKNREYFIFKFQTTKKVQRKSSKKMSYIVVLFLKNDRIGGIKYVSVCPLNWVIESTLYWPKHTKNDNDTLHKIRDCSKVEKEWIKFKNFKILFDGDIFGKII